jgi:hypothetical protein
MGRPRAHRLSITRHSALGTHHGPSARTVDVGCLWIVDGRRSPRRTAHVEVPIVPVYTSGQMLEIGPENCHFVPLWGTPGVTAGCQSSIGKTFGAKQIGPDTGCSRAIKMPRGMRRPRTDTSISAPCSLTEAEISPPPLPAARV